MNSDNSGHGADHSGLRHFHEGGSFEDQAGYSRAVGSGRLIAVSGTTCRPECAARDTRAQTEDCLRRVIAAVERLGGARTDIVRTRLFLTPDADWRAATSVHRELLGDVAPANTTLFVHALIGPDLLVEVEAEAWVRDPTGTMTGPPGGTGGGAETGTGAPA